MVLVMLCVAVAFITAMSFLTAQATTGRIAQNIDQQAVARGIGETALQLAVEEIRAGGDWRTRLPHGTWVTEQPFVNGDASISGGNFTITVEDGFYDPQTDTVVGDGSLSDDPLDPVTVTAVGRYLGVTHTVRARVVASGGEAVTPGVYVRYYQSSTSLSQLSDINWNATPVHSEIIPQINRVRENSSYRGWPGGPTDLWAAKYTARLQVPRSGLWTFYTESDDGSDLYIDGQRVVNNDGLHSMTRRSGTVNLSAGSHDIEVRFFENYVDQGIIVSWSGPGIGSLEVIPAGAFTCNPPSQPQTEQRPQLAVRDDLDLWSRVQILPFDPASPTPRVSTNSTSSDDLSVADRAHVEADVACGPGGLIDDVLIVGSKADVTGNVSALSTAVAMPTLTMPTDVGPSKGSLYLFGSQTLHLTGNARYSSVYACDNSRIVVNGNVTLRVDGDFEIDENAAVEVQSGTLTLYVAGDVGVWSYGVIGDATDPSKVRILMTGGTDFQACDRTEVNAWIENPSGGMELWGNYAIFRGRYIGEDFEAGDRVKIYLDNRVLDSDSQTEQEQVEITYQVLWDESP